MNMYACEYIYIYIYIHAPVGLCMYTGSTHVCMHVYVCIYSIYVIDRKRWIESPSAFAPSVRLAFD